MRASVPEGDRYESWRNILFDSLAQELDLSDGRYMFRTRWTDADIARSMFPKRAAVIERSSSTSLEYMRGLDGSGDGPMDAIEEDWSQSGISGSVDGYLAERDRVRLVEAWFRIPVQERFMRGGQFAGEVFDPRSPGHMRDIERRQASLIQQLSGVTDENMGRTTNATSGRAIVARQDQGALATAVIFDNLRYARQIHGSKMLSLTEQFMTEQKQFRITNMRGNAEFITINDSQPENDIVSTKADFIISEDTGVYLDGDRLLHHFPNRASVIQPLTDTWRSRIVAFMRYAGS